jgi:hypothetical protein
MGRLSDNVLSELRSPRKALSDLVAKFNDFGPHHPHRPMWERMIRQLESEVTLRGAMGRRYSQSGLC